MNEKYKYYVAESMLKAAKSVEEQRQEANEEVPEINDRQAAE
jgi:hypothetical protein